MKLQATINQTLITFLFLMISITFTSAQVTHFKNKYFQRSQFKEKVDSLRKRFANNKIIPKKVELATLVALSHYPELAKEKIAFKFKKISSTMQAQPHLSFLFRNKKERQYVIFINSMTDKSTGLSLDDLSFNALVGWIGHELGHIVDYTKKSKLGIISTGIGYLFDQYKSRYEKEIDTITIQHGLGYALYEGMEYVYNSDQVSEEYKNNLKEHYMSLDDIVSKIEEYEENK